MWNPFRQKEASKSVNTNDSTNSKQVRLIGSNTPSWVNLSETKDLLSAYCNTPPLSAVINYEARVFSNFKWKHYKKSSGSFSEIDNSKLIKRLDNPNPLQSGMEFNIQNFIFLSVFGNSHIFNVSSGFSDYYKEDYANTINLWNLPSQHIGFKTKCFDFAANSINDIVEYVTWDGLRQDGIGMSDLILNNDSTVEFENGQYLVGDSKIKGIRQSISNVQGVLSTKNVLINNRGAITIISSDLKEGVEIPSDSDMKSVQDSYNEKYGMNAGQWQQIFTSVPLKVDNLIPPVKDLMLSEMMKEDTVNIANAYMFPIPLLNDLADTTGKANMAEFKKQLYENVIIPKWKQYEKSFNNFYKLEEKGEKLEVDFSHIEVLQADKKRYFEIATMKTKLVLDTQAAFYNGEISEQGAINLVSESMNITIDEASKLLSLEKKNK